MDRIYFGVFAHNEEKNILNHLKKISAQRLQQFTIEKIIVVSSGSTDKTDEIVKEHQNQDARVELLRQEKRMGKANAIDTFLQMVPNDAIVVMASADTLLADEDVIQKLCQPLLDDNVGMTTTRPIPLNSQQRLIGKAVFMLWELKHLVSLEYPKTGEVVAFKKVFGGMPHDILVDEAFVEFMMQKANLQIIYVPDAIVYNKGPESFKELLRQRKRIYVGHKLIERQGYKGSTFDILLVLRKAAGYVVKHPAYFLPTVLLFSCEGIARILGSIELLSKRYSRDGLWDICESTKALK